MAGKLKIVGQKFGKLLVTKEAFVQKRKWHWECLCDCGNIKIVSGWKLTSKHTRSCGCLNKLPQGKASLNRLFSNYKNSAAKRNLVFNITLSEFEKLTKLNCYYCDQPPSQIFYNLANNGPFLYNGIDRKNNNIGYVVENCIPCCGWCNKMKLNYETKDFLEKCKKITERYVGKIIK